jgi:hypothetical protein
MICLVRAVAAARADHGCDHWAPPQVAHVLAFVRAVPVDRPEWSRREPREDGAGSGIRPLPHDVELQSLGAAPIRGLARGRRAELDAHYTTHTPFADRHSGGSLRGSLAD